MSEFKGKNNYGKLADQFIYKNYFFRDGHSLMGPEVFDFDFIEFQNYGCIDLDGSSIYLKEENLKTFESSEDRADSFQAVDFVVEMFNDVKTNLNLANFMGEINLTNEFLQRMEIKRAYESPKKLYKSYLGNLLITFNNSLEANTESFNKITSFEQFVKEFMTFLKENYQNQPITFSSWSQSGLNSLFSTGLAISISDLPFDNDDRKYDEFMSAESFSYYKRICLNRGFRVNQHIPFVLVADLTSPAIASYINNINIIDLIDNNYNKCYNIEYNILKNKIIEYYNILIERNPFFTKLETCRSKTTKTTVYRNPITTENNSNVYDDFYWYDLYLDVRNIENGMYKSKSDISRIKKYLKNLRNTLDKSDVLGYIDSNFRLESFNKPFGFYHMQRREKEAKKQKDQKEGITGGSTVIGGSTGGY